MGPRVVVVGPRVVVVGPRVVVVAPGEGLGHEGTLGNGQAETLGGVGCLVMPFVFFFRFSGNKEQQKTNGFRSCLRRPCSQQRTAWCCWLAQDLSRAL